MTHLDILRSKIYSEEKLLRHLMMWRLQNKKIVFTNGCFDILHQGHIDYLSKAADMGNILVVGVNSDSSVRQLGKGKSRPLQDENSRTMILASLYFVNAVILFQDNTPYNLIKIIQPDMLVKGGDWEKEKIVGYDIVTNNGGTVTTIPYLEGHSTSAIEKKIIDFR